jgi:hypothetical protein
VGAPEVEDAASGGGAALLRAASAFGLRVKIEFAAFLWWKSPVSRKRREKWGSPVEKGAVLGLAVSP